MLGNARVKTSINPRFIIPFCFYCFICCEPNVSILHFNTIWFLLNKLLYELFMMNIYHLYSEPVVNFICSYDINNFSYN